MVKKNMYRRFFVLLTALSSACVLYSADISWYEAAPLHLLPDFLPDFNGDSGCQQGAEEFICEVCKCQCPDRESLGAHWRDCMDQVLGASALDNPRNGHAGGRISENPQDGRLEDDIDEEGDEGDGGGEPAKVRKRGQKRRRDQAGSEPRWEKVNGSYVCLEPCCTKKYTSMGSLKVHHRVHTGEKPYECKMCGKKFSIGANLKAHIPIHSGQKPFECELCPKTFLNKKALTKHEGVHNRRRTGEKPFKCEEADCDKKFSQKSSLTVHMRMHSGEMLHTCQQCNRGFTNSSLLESHMRIHTGERPFECPKCDKRFKQSGHLSGHLKTHDRQMIVQPQYEWPISNPADGSRQSDFATHEDTHPVENPVQPSYRGRKILSCKVCGQEYKTQGPFKKHQAACVKQLALVQAHEC